MLQVTQHSLDPALVRVLQTYQGEIDALPVNDAWKEKLDTIWINKSRNLTFDTIKTLLADMCPGVMRCCYCEDSAAASIEHIRPKVLYPQMTFLWENFLYICGKCNSGKGAGWAIFVQINSQRQLSKIPRWRQGQPRTFPPDGDPVLINPRVEDPTTFLRLIIDPNFDKLDFVELRVGRTDEEILRATYSRETLRLNSDHRPELASQRSLAYSNYKSRLTRYVLGKREGWSQDRMYRIISELKREAHPTVWFEIKRFQREGKLDNVDPEFSQLFVGAPEALGW